MVCPNRAGPRVARWGEQAEVEVARENCRHEVLLAVRVQEVVRNGVVEGVDFHDFDAHVWEVGGPEQEEGHGQ